MNPTLERHDIDPLLSSSLPAWGHLSLNNHIRISDQVQVERIFTDSPRVSFPGRDHKLLLSRGEGKFGTRNKRKPALAYAPETQQRLDG